jgi:hypothetical protein
LLTILGIILQTGSIWQTGALANVKYKLITNGIFEVNLVANKTAKKEEKKAAPAPAKKKK